MKLAEIEKIGTIHGAYNQLLPLVQKTNMPNHIKTKEDISMSFILDSLSLEIKSRKLIKGSVLNSTFEEVIERTIRCASYRNIEIV